jgi:hypothetical protein
LARLLCVTRLTGFMRQCPFQTHRCQQSRHKLGGCWTPAVF